MKKMILLLGLILGICNMGVTAFAEESSVEVQINTRREDATIWEGTENIELDIYDLTEWRIKRASDERTDKKYIMNTYSTKEKLKTFVENEQLKQLNGAPITLDGNGIAKINLPRYQSEKDAAYLILSSEETGKYHMVPIIIYLPQYHPLTKQEAFSLSFRCKYGEIPTVPTTEPPPTTDTSTSDSSTTEPSISDSSGSRKSIPGTPIDSGPKTYPKELPSTNELIRNYCLVGLLLMFVGLVGLKKQGGKKL